MFMQMKREVLHLGGYSREFFVSRTPELTEMADVVIHLVALAKADAASQRVQPSGNDMLWRRCRILLGFVCRRQTRIRCGYLCDGSQRILIRQLDNERRATWNAVFGSIVADMGKGMA
jgi:hypothetical protein